MTFTAWRSRALVLCVATLAIPAIPVLASDFEFVVEGPFPIDPFPVEPFAADFDDDGHIDLAVSRGNGLSLLRGDGEGGFLPALAVSLGGFPFTLAVGDFDEDGSSDLLVGYFGTTVELLLGDGSGDFVSTLVIDVGTSQAHVAVADFDADGNLDFAVNRDVSTPGAASVAVYLGDGLAGFSPPVETATQDRPINLLATDLDGDGAVDLVVGHRDFAAGTGIVTVLLGDGMGGFTSDLEIATGPVLGIQSEDLDGNDLPDLVVRVDDSSALCGSIVTIYLADGLGGFDPGQTFTGVCGPHAAIPADFDGDGIADLLITDGGDFVAAVNEVLIHRGLGDGTFSGPDSIVDGIFTLAGPAVADFDEDGRLDFGLAELGTSAFLLRNVTQPAELPFRRGDADANGTFSGLVDGLFILNFQFVPGSPGPPCLDAADVDDDGSFSGLIDGLAALNFQFVPGSPPPPPPGVDTCGEDPTADLLGCLSYPCP